MIRKRLNEEAEKYVEARDEVLTANTTNEITERETRWLLNRTFNTVWIPKAAQYNVTKNEIDELRAMSDADLKAMELDDIKSVYRTDRFSEKRYVINISLEEIRHTRGSGLMSLCENYSSSHSIDTVNRFKEHPDFPMAYKWMTAAKGRMQRTESVRCSLDFETTV